VNRFNEKLKENYYQCSELIELESNIVNHLNSVQISNESNKNEGEDRYLLIGEQLGDGIFSTAKSIVEELKSPTNETSLILEDKKILVLSGDNCCGKTSFLINFIQNYKNTLPENILVVKEFICNEQEKVTDVMLRIICKIRCQVAGRSTIAEMCCGNESFEEISEMFKFTLQQIPCFIFIDGIDQLHGDNPNQVEKVKSLEWIPDSLPSFCRVVMTTNNCDLTLKYLSMRSDTIRIKFPQLKTDSLQQVALTNITPSVKDFLTSESLIRISELPFSDNLIVTSFVVSLLKLCKNNQSVEHLLIQLAARRNLNLFWRGSLNFISRKLSWGKEEHPGSFDPNTTSGWVADALKLLLCCNRGLLQLELLHMLHLMGYTGHSIVTPHDLLLFVSFCHPVVRCVPGGNIIISNKSVKQSLARSLMNVGTYNSKSQDLQLSICSFIASYFEKFSTKKRQIVELPWQLVKTKNFEKLKIFLTEPRNFIEMSRISTTDVFFLRQIISYWNILNTEKLDVVQLVEEMLLNEKRKNSDEFSDGVRDLFIVMSQLNINDVKYHINDTQSNESCVFERKKTVNKNKNFLNTDWSPEKAVMKKQDGNTDFSRTDVIKLKFYAAWFLYIYEKNYSKSAKKLAIDCKKFIEISEPLNFEELLVNLQLVDLLCKMKVSLAEDKLVGAVVNCQANQLELLELNCEEKKAASKSRGDIQLYIADLLIQQSRFLQAKNYILMASEEYQLSCNFDGESICQCYIAQILSKQGKLFESEELFQTSLKEVEKVHGKSNSKVAFVRTCLADHYCRYLDKNNENIRRALLSYKEALEIYERNKNYVQCARILTSMGKLLDMEATLNSKNEALYCFQTAKDLLNLNCDSFSKNYKIVLDRNYKKTALDLMTGRFKYSGGYFTKKNPPIKYHRPHSFMSCAPNTDLYDVIQVKNTPQKFRRLTSSYDLYRPYTVNLYGTEPVLSNKKNDKITIEKMLAGKTELLIEESNTMDEENVKLEVESLSVKLGIDEFKNLDKLIDAKMPLRLPGLGNNLKKDELSVAMKFINRTNNAYRPKTTPYILRKALVRADHKQKTINRLHRPKSHHHHKTLRQTSTILQNIHGPHSQLDSLQNPPPKPRENVRKGSGLVHKSALYDVPGRYITSGSLYMPKRNQIPSGTWIKEFNELMST